MTVRHRIDTARGLVLVTLEGAMSVEQYRAFLDALAQEGGGPWGLLVDASGLERNLPTHQVRDVAMMLTDAAPRLGVTRLAIVAPTDVTFGQSRMFEAFSAVGPVRTHVARTADLAITWLLETA